MTQQIGLPDPDMALTDPKGYQQQLTQYLYAQQTQQLAAAAGPVFEQLASTAKELSKNDPKNRDIWQKYGSQVEAMVANVPANLRTKDLYDQAVIMVKGQKFDELATEKAASLAAAGTGLARAGSADESADTASGDAAVWEKIEASPMGAAAIKVAGKQGILKAIRAGAYKSLEDYAAKAAASKSKVDSANPNIVYNRSVR